MNLLNFPLVVTTLMATLLLTAFGCSNPPADKARLAEEAAALREEQELARQEEELKKKEEAESKLLPLEVAGLYVDSNSLLLGDVQNTFSEIEITREGTARVVKFGIPFEETIIKGKDGLYELQLSEQKLNLPVTIKDQTLYLHLDPSDLSLSSPTTEIYLKK